jgi:hypothetical protein
MRVELHVNGAVQVILIPETPIDNMVLFQMQDSAKKGRAVKLEALVDGPNVGSATVSVEA